MGRGVAIALAVVAACGDNAAPADDGAQSGTRLKIVDSVFSDGTRVWGGFYDSQRQEKCNLSEWSDGNLYCTPAGAEVVFADAACTQPAAKVFSPACSSPPPTYALETLSGCDAEDGEVVHLFTVSSKLALTSYYTMIAKGFCSQAIPAVAGSDFYSLGAEVSSTALAQVQVGSPVGGGRLAPRYATSSDGLRFPWILHDTTLGDCSEWYSFWPQDPATSACVPNALGYADYDSDATCTAPVLAVHKTCATPRFAYWDNFSATACPSDPVQYFPVTTSAGTSLYQDFGTCSLATYNPAYDYFNLDVGEGVTPAIMDRVHESVAGRRLQRIYATASDGVRWRDHDLYDSQTGAECAPLRGSDGVVRCLDIGAQNEYYLPLFSDPGCTTALDAVEFAIEPASCMVPPPQFVVDWRVPADSTCTYEFAIRQVGPPYTGPMYNGTPGSCAAVSVTFLSFYQLGPVVPWTDFDAATDEIEN